MPTSVRFFRGIISANVQPQEVGSSNIESLLKPSRVGHDKMQKISNSGYLLHTCVQIHFQL